MKQLLAFKKLSPLRYCCLLFVLSSLFSVLRAQPISQEEKDAVVATLADCIRNDIVYISSIKKYQDMNHLAEKFQQAWDMAKEGERGLEHSILGVINPTSWEEIAKTTDRDEFRRVLNSILRKMFSHFKVEDAQDDLVSQLEKYKNELGITYRESDTTSPYQEYVVESVLPGGKAAQEGIRVGDTFSLCSANDVPIEYRETGPFSFILTFKIEFKPKGLPLKSISIRKNGKLSPHTSFRNYKIEPSYRALLEKEYSKHPSTPLSIRVRSFLTEGYENDNVATSLEFAVSKDMKELILDLRGNSGGSGTNANHLLSFFIEPGKPYGISVTKQAWQEFQKTPQYEKIVGSMNSGRHISATFFQEVAEFYEQHYPDLLRSVPKNDITENRPRYKGRLAIFVDGKTASSAEMVAMALKTFLGDRCYIVGEKSAGALLVITFPRYVGCFKITYPGFEYLPIGGVRVEGVGIHPDVTVASNVECIRAALRWFMSHEAETPIPVPPLVEIPSISIGETQGPIGSKIQAALVDCYWIAVDPRQGTLITTKVEFNGQVYDIDKKVQDPTSDKAPWLFHLSKPILEPIRRPDYPEGITNWINCMIIRQALKP